jgi:hypothetical protein
VRQALTLLTYIRLGCKCLLKQTHRLINLILGTRKLKGENLKVVWAEFSTLSWDVLFLHTYCMAYMHTQGQTFSVTSVHNKLECLSLAGIYS